MRRTQTFAEPSIHFQLASEFSGTTSSNRNLKVLLTSDRYLDGAVEDDGAARTTVCNAAYVV